MTTADDVILWVAVTANDDDSPNPRYAVEVALVLTDRQLAPLARQHWYIDPSRSHETDPHRDDGAPDRWDALPLDDRLRRDDQLRDDWCDARLAAPAWVDHVAASMITNVGQGAAPAITLAGPDLTRDLPVVLGLMPRLSTRFRPDYLDTSKLVAAWSVFGDGRRYVPRLADDARADDRLDRALTAAARWVAVFDAADDGTVAIRTPDGAVVGHAKATGTDEAGRVVMSGEITDPELAAQLAGPPLDHLSIGVGSDPLRLPMDGPDVPTDWAGR